MNLLFLTFVFPLIGFLLLSFSRGRFSENLSALIGVGSIGLSAIVAAYVIWQFNVAPPEGGHYTLVLWQWMSVEGFKPNFALYVDGLSITMLGVVVGVGGATVMAGGDFVLSEKYVTADLMAAGPKLAGVIARYRDEFASPYQAAENGMINDVIAPSETRSTIALAASDQAR